MAIGPEFIRGYEEETLRVLEAEIDASLRNGKADMQNRVCVNVPSRLTPRLWAALAPRYLNAGWKETRYTPDQRDGDYLEFFF